MYEVTEGLARVIDEFPMRAACEIDAARTTALMGPAKPLALLNCSAIHGSVPNLSDRS